MYGRRMTYNLDEKQVSKAINKVFLWMFSALLVTFITAAYIFSNPNLYQAVLRSYMPVVIMQFGVVMFFSFMINKISAATAKILFYLYAALTGVTFSVLGMIFSAGSITLALALTTILFAVMAIYGYVTKEDLSKYTSLLTVGLIILVVASLLNMFLIKGPMFYMVISYFGVILFIALIGYDVNRIKYMLMEIADGDEEVLAKYSIFGALKLYLDFINLFIYILRIFGRSRD